MHVCHPKAERLGGGGKGRGRAASERLPLGIQLSTLLTAAYVSRRTKLSESLLLAWECHDSSSRQTEDKPKFSRPRGQKPLRWHLH